MVTASRVLMVRPHHFRVNVETASDNRYQREGGDIALAAYREITAAAAMIEAAGLTVLLEEGADPETPDCVFPNNWMTTHRDGRIALFPMRAPNRRAERRDDIVERLRARFHVSEVVDYSPAEDEERFLEGTGSMVLDRDRRIAFAATGTRTDPKLFERFCADFDYAPIAFEARDADGHPIYHTNVMMSLGTGYALVGLECLGAGDRERVVEALGEREIVDLSHEQISSFCGNALELAGEGGPVLAMSTRAHDALAPAQRAAIARHARLLVIPLDAVEQGGGSLRCTLAEIYLPEK